MRNLLRLKKENKAIKDRMNRDIRISFKEDEDYYKLKRVSNLRNNNYIE